MFNAETSFVNIPLNSPSKSCEFSRIYSHLQIYLYSRIHIDLFSDRLLTAVISSCLPFSTRSARTFWFASLYSIVIHKFFFQVKIMQRIENISDEQMDYGKIKGEIEETHLWRMIAVRLREYESVDEEENCRLQWSCSEGTTSAVRRTNEISHSNACRSCRSQDSTISRGKIICFFLRKFLELKE